MQIAAADSVSPEEWDDTIAVFPNAHILQTAEWAAIKAPIGWKPFYITWKAGEKGEAVCAAALVLERTLPIAGLSARVRILYVPRGPLLSDWDDSELVRKVLADLEAFARQRRAMFIKIDPDVPVAQGLPDAEDEMHVETGRKLIASLRQYGWQFSSEQIQFRNTMVMDLSLDEAALLARMKQKTRYNIRLAARRGVVIRRGNGDDLEGLYRMYAETSLRDGFVIRDQRYYLRLWHTFIERGFARPLIAEVEGEAVAGLILFMFHGQAWYLYGMSKNTHRQKMPNYLLQWEAIRQAKETGCSRYDLWGAPDDFDPEDSMWGVYRFKAGLGAHVVRTIGAWDRPLRPWLYAGYTRLLPRLLTLARRRGKAQTRAQTQDS